MKMKLGERCIYPECGWQFIAARTGEFECASNPRCCCGSLMKKTNVRHMAKRSHRSPVTGHQ
jgi:hypothetical protein